MEDAGKAIGKAGGGIDGVIKEDKLGVDLLTFKQGSGITPPSADQSSEIRRGFAWQEGAEGNLHHHLDFL